MRKLFAIVAALFTLAVVLQFYLAAIGVFSNPDDELFAIHGANGRYVLALLALLTILTAALARSGKRTIWLSALAVGLLVLQTVLFIVTGLIFNIGPDDASVPIGATITLGFHAIIGVAILFVSSVMTRRAWVLAFPRSTAPTTQAPAVTPAS